MSRRKAEPQLVSPERPWVWTQEDDWSSRFTLTSQGWIEVRAQYGEVQLLLADTACHGAFRDRDAACHFVEAHYRPGDPALNLPQDRSDRPVLPMRLISAQDDSSSLLIAVRCLLEDARGVRYRLRALSFIQELHPCPADVNALDP